MAAALWARHPRAIVLAWSCVVVFVVALLFYGPARAASGGDWPAPLDDVYIHYDFARALAEGHPFEWIAGQGDSSGETAPLYAVVLAVGYVAGFHGTSLGLWAALVACASLVFMAHVLSRLVVRLGGRRWVALVPAPLV